MVEKPAKFTEQFIDMPDAAQLQFFMGHVGVRRDNADYYKLLVMDYVLGTGPGFTDRLSARLRDREGLAYTVQANITSTADREPGVFTCYIGTAPMNFERAKKEFLEEINRIRDEKATKEEVEDAKQYLLGNLPFNFTTNSGVAGQLLYIERNNLGFSFLEDYRKAVAAVTPEDVQAVAQEVSRPEAHGARRRRKKGGPEERLAKVPHRGGRRGPQRKTPIISGFPLRSSAPSAVRNPD